MKIQKKNNLKKFNKNKNKNKNLFYYTHHKGGITNESVSKTDEHIIKKFLKIYE